MVGAFQWRSRRAAALGLKLRAEVHADQAFTAALYASTRMQELAPVPWSEAQKAAFLRQQHDAQRHHYRTYYPQAEWLIVEHDGVPAGRFYFERWPSQIRVIDIALMPEARGRGFGTALMSDLMEDAFAMGKAVSIHVEKNNPAKNLYRRLGFSVAEDKGVHDLMVCPCPADAGRSSDAGAAGRGRVN